MESLGDKLKTAREARGLDLEQVCRDTNISIRYLEALETEYFNNFPGEPYIIGFLRTYSSYLDLDVNELISLYRALKIQEQPVPVEQLLKRPSVLPKIAFITAIVLAVCGLIGGGYYLFTRPRKPEAPAAVKRTPAEYVMNGDSLERRLYPGDAILITLDNTRYKLELGSLSDVVMIRTPVGFERLALGQTVNIDLNMNGKNDVQITASDFVRNKADTGVLIRIESVSAQESIAGTEPDIPDESAASSAASVVIFSSPNAYPFTLQSNFQGYCLFRWEILRERDRRDRNEQYFQKADELNIQAQNGIRIWASNAQAAKFQVIGGGRTVPVALGNAGEVVVAEVHWVRDEENRYRLILVRLET